VSTLLLALLVGTMGGSGTASASPASPSAVLPLAERGKDIPVPPEEVRLQVFDLSGRTVYDSGFQRGRTVQWNLQTQEGAPAANGVYWAVVTVRDREGRLHVRLQRVWVLR